MSGPGRTAVIGGTGDEGFGLTLRWARAGMDLVIGSRDQEKAERAAARVSQQVPSAKVEGMLNPEAAMSSEIVVVTVPFAGQAGIYRSIAEKIRPGTVVVDCTVPVAAAVGGKPTRMLGVWEGSAAQQARGLLPEEVKLASAFHTLSAEALSELDADLEGDVLACGPREAKDRVRLLVDLLPGLRFVDAGPLENARLLEPLTALLIGINRRYRVDRAGIRITGLPG